MERFPSFIYQGNGRFWRACLVPEYLKKGRNDPELCRPGDKAPYGVPEQVRAERTLKAMWLTARLQVRVSYGDPVASCIEYFLLNPGNALQSRTDYPRRSWASIQWEIPG